MRTSSLILAAMTATLATATAARAEGLAPEGLGVGPLVYEGDGCPDGTALGALAPNGTYGIVFSALEAAVLTPASAATSHCTVSVDVRLPVNYRMQVASVAVQGKHDAPGDSDTTVVTDYTMNGYRIGYDLNPKRGQCQEHYQPSADDDEIPRDAVVESIGGIPSEAGNWQIAWRNQDLEHFTSCGGAVHFGGTIAVTADANGSQDLPEMVVQRADARLAYGLGWGWRFQKCLDVLNGLWRAEFVDTNGRTRTGSMALSYSRGSVSGAGATITLAAIDQSDTVVTGTWQRGDEQGWIRLETAANPPLDRMNGVWGYGLESGQDPIGSFSAVRVR